MATTTRKSVIKSEKKEFTATAEINGWVINFKYKSEGDKKPDEYDITGNKTGTLASFQYTKNLNSDAFSFYGGIRFDRDIVNAVMDEIELIEA